MISRCEILPADQTHIKTQTVNVNVTRPDVTQQRERDGKRQLIPLQCCGTLYCIIIIRRSLVNMDYVIVPSALEVLIEIANVTVT